MQTKDKLKEEIGFEKLLMTLLVAVITSLASWAWSNQVVFSTFFKATIEIFLVYLLFAVVVLFIRIKNKIKELDKYD